MQKLRNVFWKVWRRLYPILVWLVVIYLYIEIFDFVVSNVAHDDLLDYAQVDPGQFIKTFAVMYAGFIVTTVSILYAAHRLLNLQNDYEIVIGILGMITVFTTLSTLLVEFAGSNIPKPFLVLTLVNVLLSVSLTTTSKLLKWRRKYENVNRREFIHKLLE
ncbi:hypothetical protein [Weissella minor]|uniref:hypothetical protein n=1 Tax=Weissella minor TaxID=1620 RepID=UPI003AF29C72